MYCHLCGGELKKLRTDIPFKVTDTSIVILKRLPILQCHNCCEYIIEDKIMEQVDRILSQSDQKAELEIFSYAA